VFTALADIFKSTCLQLRQEIGVLQPRPQGFFRFTADFLIFIATILAVMFLFDVLIVYQGA